jgi:CheY-like chemotaxis protein
LVIGFISNYDLGAKMTDRFNVLLVDDNEDHLVLGRRLLRSTPNIEIITANSGADALEQIASGLLPDVVIMDTEMYPMTGPQVCIQMREKHDFPVIALSSKLRNLSEWEGTGFSRFNQKRVALREHTLIPGIVRAIQEHKPLYELVFIDSTPVSLPFPTRSVSSFEIDQYHNEGGLGLIYCMSLPLTHDGKTVYQLNRIKNTILKQRPDAYFFFLVDTIDPSFKIGYTRGHDDVEQVIPQITLSDVYDRVLGILDKRYLEHPARVYKNDGLYVLATRKHELERSDNLSEVINMARTTHQHVRLHYSPNGSESFLSLDEQMRAQELLRVK